MQVLAERNDIRYGLLEEVDLAEMARTIGDVFSQSDPLAVAAHITTEEIQAFVSMFGPKAVAEGLTVIARDRSGKLVGAMFSEDFGTPTPHLEHLPESFAPVGALLDSLDAAYRLTQSIVVGSHAHLVMLAVFSSLSGRGIAQNLVKLCLENAAKRGYRLAVTEATGPISQHIFRKLGFRERLIASYKDFRFDDQPVFESIEIARGTILMDFTFLS